MTAPSVSVIIPVYNNAPYLVAAIDSILQQSFQDFECIIIDDGSTDGSGAIIDDCARADSRIRVLRHPGSTNRGIVISLNKGAAAARAPLIARFDGDDIAHKDRLGQQVHYMHDHPEVDILGGQVKIIDHAGNPIGEVHFPLNHNEIKANLDIVDGRLHKPVINSPSAMIRTHILREAGGYRRPYGVCEDYDLWARLIDHHHFANLPDFLVDYRRSPTQTSTRRVIYQAYGTVTAYIALCERRAGRPDPTDTLDELPPLGQLDTLFKRTGLDALASKYVTYVGRHCADPKGRNLLLQAALCCAHTLKGTQEKNARRDLWHLSARLLKWGSPISALRLAMALIRP